MGLGDYSQTPFYMPPIGQMPWSNNMWQNFSMPMFNGGFTMNSMPMFNSGFTMNTPVFEGSTSSSLSEEQKTTQVKNNVEKIKKLREQQKQEITYDVTNLENLVDLSDAKVTENEDKTKTVTTNIDDLQTMLNKSEEKINNSHKKADGSIVLNESVKEYRKKTPWYKRAGRAVCNGVQGVWKLATNFIGYEDGKWNWKKCLKNVAIAAGAIAACAIPGVGPVISTALIASGVAAGAFGVGKGIYKAATAKTTTDLDNAFQDIGAGAAIGITSACGIKGVAKGATAGTGASTASGKASFIQNLKNAPKELVDSFRPSTWKAAFKATGQNMNMGSNAIKTNGFWKTYSGNLKSAFIEPIKTGVKKSKNGISGEWKGFKDNYFDKTQWTAKKFYQIPRDLVKYPVKLAFGVMGLMFKPWEMVRKTPAGAEYRIQQVLAPEYESYMFSKSLSKEEADATLAQIKQTKEELEKAKKDIDDQINQLRTKNLELNYA